MLVDQVAVVCGNLGFNSFWAVNKVGKGGGLALLWKEGWELNVLSMSKGHIDSRVRGPQNAFTGRITGIYGHPKTNLRYQSWELLERLSATISNEAWLVVGDFNEITEDAEQEGQCRRRIQQMRLFSEALDACDLQGIRTTGYRFTWNNRREGQANVRARLDRVVINNEMHSQYPYTRAYNVLRWESNHLPILVYTDRPMHDRGKHAKFKSRFHFEEMWTTKEGCEAIIRDTWQQQNEDVMRKISTCTEKLSQWNQIEIGHIPQQRRALHEKLEAVLMKGETTENRKLRQHLADEHEHIMLEESLWRQRSRVEWLKGGDRNTKFFHQTGKDRGQRKNLKGIQDAEGNWCSTTSEIGASFCSYFAGLFTSEGTGVSEEIVDAIQTKVIDAQNELLVRPYVREEIEGVLKQMNPSKWPGPDGLPALFYQRYWNIVGDSVVTTCLKVLNEGESVESLNSTLIALVPKTGNAREVIDLRPISLCNVLYKLISKTVANCLKLVLPEVISDYQSAIVPGRNIHDNIVAAFETIHTINKRGKS